MVYHSTRSWRQFRCFVVVVFCFVLFFVFQDNNDTLSVRLGDSNEYALHTIS